MNNKIRGKQAGLLAILSAAFFLVSCEDYKDIVQYDTARSYIYFAVPNPVTTGSQKYIDSIAYSFAISDPDSTEKTIVIPVNVAGLASDGQRTYKYEVVAENSSYDPSLVEISDPVIPAGAYSGELKIKIRKAPILRDSVMRLYLRLKDNENYQVGNKYNETLDLTFTNQLTQPAWWTRWKTYFGDFYPEVYELWIRIYYLGADPSPELGTTTPGPVYYWNNMPYSPNAEWYPVTHMFIEVLRQYLLDNPVYPGGDASKPRIYLP